MHYSSIFVYCFIGVVNLSFSGANPAWNAILPINSNNYSASTATGYNKASNIENGETSLYGALSAPTAKKLTPFSNFGKLEFTSNNTDVTVNNDQSNSNDLNSAGTSFVHNKNNRMDLFNIGYGSANQNKVVISDTAAKTDNTGSQPLTSSEVGNHLTHLHRLSDELQEIVNQLIIQLEEQ